MIKSYPALYIWVGSAQSLDQTFNWTPSDLTGVVPLSQVNPPHIRTVLSLSWICPRTASVNALYCSLFASYSSVPTWIVVSVSNTGFSPSIYSSNKVLTNSKDSGFPKSKWSKTGLLVILGFHPSNAKFLNTLVNAKAWAGVSISGTTFIPNSLEDWIKSLNSSLV